MADLADIQKKLKRLLDEYSPKDKATSKATRVPTINPDLKMFIDNALWVYGEYESGNIKDSEFVIQSLHNGLVTANALLKESYINSLIIEKRERSNADFNYALGAEKGTKNGIKIQRQRHGSNTSGFLPYEQEIIKLMTEYDTQSPFGKKQTAKDVIAKIEKLTGLMLTQSNYGKYRDNYKKSYGKTIFKITNE